MKPIASNMTRTMPKKNSLTLTNFLPYRLAVASARSSGKIAEEYGRRFGLSMQEWRCISVLAEHTELAAIDIARTAAMDKVTVHRAVQKLLNRQLVEKRKDEADARRSLLRLSRAGTEIYADIVPIALRIEEQIINTLGPKKAKLLSDLLLEVQIAIDKQS